MAASASGVKKQTNEEIIEGFNQLRQDQRLIAQRMSKIDAEKAEHAITIEALKEVDTNRTCFRLVGGVLIERTVGEVLPALQKNSEQLESLVETLNKQLIEKGKSITQYREKHNIKVRGEAGAEGSNKSAAAGDGDAAQTSSAAAGSSSGGVLVPSS